MKIKEKLEKTLELCDGYSYVEDTNFEKDYKKFYHFVKKDSKILFPFIYITVFCAGEYLDRTMCFIPRKKYIFVNEKGMKTF